MIYKAHSLSGLLHHSLAEKIFVSSRMQKGQDDETRPLPGFRFHPTDEELVGFYLLRKVDKKPLKIDHIIQQIDIYKHDPWDLPKTSEGLDSKELYFFCKRGRKYRNSIRPNRVTGSGFWKATGIDKQVWSSGGASIGLKKTLVYYRGSAGKGTKTDWMMHEFRLPYFNSASDKCPTQEAEVWTVCRIMKRNLPKKYAGDWRKTSSKQVSCEYKPPRTTYILEADDHTDGYISFNGSGPTMTVQYYDNDDKNSINVVNNNYHPENHNYINNHDLQGMFNNSSASTSSSSYFNAEIDQFAYDNWDELRPAVDFALW